MVIAIDMPSEIAPALLQGIMANGERQRISQNTFLYLTDHDSTARIAGAIEGIPGVRSCCVFRLEKFTWSPKGLYPDLMEKIENIRKGSDEPGVPRAIPS
jgi:hypothetical protein